MADSYDRGQSYMRNANESFPSRQPLSPMDIMSSRSSIKVIFNSLFIVAVTAAMSSRTGAEELEFFQAAPNYTSDCGCAEDCCCESYSCDSCCCGRGTLFLWGCAPNITGGPDLSEPLITDRPDFTESSVAVGRGVAQIEFGYTYTFDEDGSTSVRSHSWGEPLLRYGILADWLEFRIAVAPVNVKTTTNGVPSTVSGSEDLYLGFKIALTPQACFLPEMALIPQMNVPTGTVGLTSDHVEPGINWVYSWEISDFLATAGSTQGNRRFDDTGDEYLEIGQSWTVAYSLADNLGAYTEWYALFPSGATSAPVEHYFNGGFTYLITNDVQFDIRGGVGLNGNADDYYVGTGLSIRYY